MKINHRTIITLTILSFLGVVFYQLYFNYFDYVELKLVYDDKENNYYEQDIPDSLTSNVKAVLTTYGIVFKDTQGKIFVLKEIMDNKEFIKNISNKSKDKTWLQGMSK